VHSNRANLPEVVAKMSGVTHARTVLVPWKLKDATPKGQRRRREARLQAAFQPAPVSPREVVPASCLTDNPDARSCGGPKPRESS
jgi:hypothetical protein